MEFRTGPFIFSSQFDSGNLGKVEQVEICEPPCGILFDYEFNLWTLPDCANTIYENGNRSWFHFSVRGTPFGKAIKFNIMNMNKQGRLYNQGMAPVYRTLSSKNCKWQRIRDRVSWESVEGEFSMSFVHRFEDGKSSTTYFAFTYPYSYDECQKDLDNLDQIHKNGYPPVDDMNNNPLSIYYHRELLCYSNDRLRIDLITISSFTGQSSEREERLVGLFPDEDKPRCHKFPSKKVIFISSRVHPGETPSSFVFNGFLKFLLRSSDPRACMLRELFVFKLIPMLNPDGVKRGHYRTDSHGVNLNRVYGEPSPSLHPSVYAAKLLMLYHYSQGGIKDLVCMCLLNKSSGEKLVQGDIDIKSDVLFRNRHDLLSESAIDSCVDNLSTKNVSQVVNHLPSIDSLPEGQTSSDIPISYILSHPANESDDMKLQRKLANTSKSINDEQNSDVAFRSSPRGLLDEVLLDEDISDLCSIKTLKLNGESDTPELASNVTVREERRTSTHVSANDMDGQPKILFPSVVPNSSPKPVEPILTCICQLEKYADFVKDGFDDIFSTEQDPSIFVSKLALYVDLHGHASKQGCFIYGNNFMNEHDQMLCMLLPKLTSVNSPNFDFSACNFSLKNMYAKDKKNGQSKEGSGRVSMFKATGLIQCYTLECNYNSGRVSNPVPPATCDNGKATPPPQPGFPPRYTPELWEEVGRSLAISVLDVIKRNPWSRLPLSEFKSLMGVNNWLYKFIRTNSKTKKPNFLEENRLKYKLELVNKKPSGNRSKTNVNKKFISTKVDLPVSQITQVKDMPRSRKGSSISPSVYSSSTGSSHTGFSTSKVQAIQKLSKANRKKIPTTIDQEPIVVRNLRKKVYNSSCENKHGRDATQPCILQSISRNSLTSSNDYELLPIPKCNLDIDLSPNLNVSHNKGLRGRRPSKSPLQFLSTSNSSYPVPVERHFVPIQISQEHMPWNYHKLPMRQRSLITLNHKSNSDRKSSTKSDSSLLGPEHIVHRKAVYTRSKGSHKKSNTFD